MIASPLSKRWHTSFCMDELAKIFDLEYWNLSGLANPTYEAREEDVIDRDYSKRIRSRFELRKNLRRLPVDTVVLSHIHPNEHNGRLHKLISSYQKNRVFVDFWGDYIPGYDNMGFVECPNDVFNRQTRSIYKRLKREYYRNNYVLSSIVNYVRMHNTARFSEWKKKYSSRLSFESYNHYTISTTQGSHYQINLPDYETYLGLEKAQSPSLVEGRYLLWIDSFYPYHPIFSSVNPEVDFSSLAEGYYACINKLFERVEKQYNMEVVIAAHPVSNFQSNPFGGRKVFINQTAQLVQHATAVMMHYSHSVIWEILWNKPICFLTNQYVKYSDLLNKDTERMANSFNMQLYDMESITDEELTTMFSKFDANIQAETRDKLSFSSGKCNAELLTEYINTIHADILRNQLNTK